MTEEKKDAESCPRRCGGCKFLAGILVGLLLAGTGFGLYMAGRSGHLCPLAAHCPLGGQENQPAK